MRNLVIATLALAAIACSQENTTLDKLITQRDSLNGVINKTQEALDAVEVQIDKLDTTKKYTQVTTVPAKQTTFDHYFEVFGSVYSDENVMLSPELAGEVLKIHVREGQRVKAGQTLLQINADVVRKSIEEVEVSLELATDLFARQERLWKQKIGSELQYLESKNRKESLESKLATLNSQLEMAAVKAPFGGTVDEIVPVEGAMVAPGQPLIRLVGLKQVHIKSDVSERYVDVINTGTRVEVEFPSINVKIDTLISRAGNYINPNNRTFVARIDVDNPSGRVKPNMLAKLRMRDYHADSVIVIPSNLIQQTPNGDNFVYVAIEKPTGSFVEKRKVSTGLSNAKSQTRVESGLTAGELIVDRGSRGIKDGQQVEILK